MGGFNGVNIFQDSRVSFLLLHTYYLLSYPPNHHHHEMIDDDELFFLSAQNGRLDLLALSISSCLISFSFPVALACGISFVGGSNHYVFPSVDVPQMLRLTTRMLCYAAICLIEFGFLSTYRCLLARLFTRLLLLPKDACISSRLFVFFFSQLLTGGEEGRAKKATAS
ncbi:uncharacterized protein K452DRAFT_39531 [Aplosporella prunicola CBS 121167]|uniref:Uncharacterized protein n=1 Tax=Aplosporella prunicola CBS 121167 TaxID=1176127 RepID=A0A6A6BCY1_9PEZI|nr:uncharacterized protein K452DRAFT_39531 [Aplosporella prunicola CBS 121167]KAF2141438.1 hypothetical protein K452DRAFT_39531 [Aplosporella prunicola CBS 121167]